MVHNQELLEMNDVQNLENNRMSSLFINHSGPFLNQFEFDTKDYDLILFDKDYGDAAGTDREGESLVLTYNTRERMARHKTERKLKS